IVDALITNHKPVSYLDIDAEQGHDSFLFPIPLYVKTLRAFLGGEEHLKSTSLEAS
ncbi:homoserine O-acetyltransferase, partial [Acinetobacter baumannii]